MSSNGETKPKLQYSKGSTTLYMTTFCSAWELCLKFVDFEKKNLKKYFKVSRMEKRPKPKL